MSRIDHVAVCVRDLEAALRLWRDGLGLQATGIEEVPGRKVRVAFLQAGGLRVELVQPTSEDSEVSSFLARRGEGLHHLAFAVDDLETALSRAGEGGAAVLPGAGKAGAGGTRVAFLHPRTANGVLVELVEGDHSRT